MERFALELASEGILFLENRDHEYNLLYYNRAATAILGIEISNLDWLKVFVRAELFLECVSTCLERKTKLTKYLTQQEASIPLLFSFYPYTSHQAIVTIASPFIRDVSFQPIFNCIYGMGASILEYHPEKKVQYLNLSHSLQGLAIYCSRCRNSS